MCVSSNVSLRMQGYHWFKIKSNYFSEHDHRLRFLPSKKKKKIFLFTIPDTVYLERKQDKIIRARFQVPRINILSIKCDVWHVSYQWPCQQGVLMAMPRYAKNTIDSFFSFQYDFFYLYFLSKCYIFCKK